MHLAVLGAVILLGEQQGAVTQQHRLLETSSPFLKTRSTLRAATKPPVAAPVVPGHAAPAHLTQSSPPRALTRVSSDPIRGPAAQRHGSDTEACRCAGMAA